MAEHAELVMSIDDVQNLQHLSDLLHLFHHRNRNQHRRSIWWRHFSTFRRQLNAFISEVEALHEVPTTHLERTRKKSRDREIKEVESKRVEFWQDVLVPKWHGSFSQIIADGRFAVLGLVLTAALAQTCQIVGVNETFNGREALEADEALQALSGFSDRLKVDPWETSTLGGDDLGEVIDREEALKEAKTGEGLLPPIEDKGGEKKPEPSKNRNAISRPPRKKRKKGNAIDDLFSGLS